jgi:ribose transport system substrate-binding protein
MRENRSVTRRGHRAVTGLAVLALTGTAVSCANNSGPSGNQTAPAIRSSAAVGRTHGPNGEKAAPASALGLRAPEVAKIRAGHHSAALVWHEASDFTEAVTTGVRDVFRPLGIRVVAETSAAFDPSKQKADIETVGGRKPDVMLTLPVDPVITAPAYKQAARQGMKIVLLSNLPRGMRHGTDYVDVVTDDLFDMGKRAADALAAAVGRKGEVAYFYRDANSFVANERDQAFLKTLSANYPQIKVAARQGIADPN